MYAALYGGQFVNHLDRPPYRYDFRTKHAGAMGGADGYLERREEELERIRAFVTGQEGTGC